MPWKIYEGPCEQCGGPARKFQPSRKGLICQDCGIGNAISAATQMSRKSGPAWDNFQKSRGASGRPPTPRQRK